MNSQAEMKLQDLEITNEDLRRIHGSDWEKFLKKIIRNCYCGHCQSNYDSIIIEYKIFLNDLNDIVLKGKCRTCKRPIARYAETGEVPQYSKRIEEVRIKYESN